MITVLLVGRHTKLIGVGETGSNPNITNHNNVKMTLKWIGNDWKNDF